MASEPFNICLPCGLCCDGTLVGFVQLDSDEIERVRKVKQIEEEKGFGFFLQPCDKFCEICTIYEDRPRRCGTFECGLLKSVEEKQVSSQSALETIRLVKEMKAKIEIGMEGLELNFKPKSFYFHVLELKRNFQNAAVPLTESEQIVLTEIELLEQLIANHFDLSF